MMNYGIRKSTIQTRGNRPGYLLYGDINAIRHRKLKNMIEKKKKGSKCIPDYKDGIKSERGDSFFRADGDRGK